MLLFLAIQTAVAQSLKFEEHTLATDLAGGYQVVASDLNHDAKLDLIALASKTSAMSAAACAVADLDGDGRPDIARIGSATHNLKVYMNTN